MRIAIIDLGTNTFNLLIADIGVTEKFIPVFNDKIAVKLGEGGIHLNKILPVPFERGLAAIATYKETIENYRVEDIHAFATSAIRSASNGGDFVAAVKANFNIEIQVIDGDKEAELIYEGVRLGVQLSEQYALIMDIGGGSTEFIIANAKGYVWKQSFNLGAARLLEKFKPSDPIKPNEIADFESYFDAELQPLTKAVKLHAVHELIGSSGSFDTFAEVISERFYQTINLKLQSSFDFKMDDFYLMHEQILKSNLQERLATPGIIPMRADMIVVSSIFTNYVLNRLQLKKMRLSTFALKEGVIAKILNSKK